MGAAALVAASLLLSVGCSGTFHQGMISSYPPDSAPERNDWDYKVEADVANGGRRLALGPNSWVTVVAESADGEEVLQDSFGIEHGSAYPEIDWQQFEVLTVRVIAHPPGDQAAGREVLRRTYRWDPRRQQFAPEVDRGQP